MPTTKLRYPVIVFYLVAMVGAGALGAVQPWTHLDPQILQLTQFGPALGVLVVGLVWRGALPPLALAIRPWPPRRVLALTGTAAAIVAVCLGWYAVSGSDPHLLPMHDLVAPLPLIAVAQFVGACGEEVGWRCFLQPLLASRLGTLPASLVVGLMWGGWHVPVFANGAGFGLAFLVAAVSLSVILGTANSDLRGNYLLPAAVFHTLINLGLLLILDEENGSVPAMPTFAVACLAAAVAWLLLARRRSARVRPL